MSFQELRRAVEGEIFDYQMLMQHLREYKKPRDKITRLMISGSIIRIKKGLYTFGPDFQRNSPSVEILANLIHPPSYISLEYALSKYGLIPERVYVVTSICLKRPRVFKTPLGTFSYKKRPLSIYPTGIKQVQVPDEGNYLIAEPEKALVDFLFQTSEIKDVLEMKEYLYENLRMELLDLRKLNKKSLIEILHLYGMRDTLIQAIYD
jgi:predicted transcriptional regulator of viral defense system